MNNSIKKIRKCRGGYLSFSTTKKYMNIACDCTGFKFSLSDEPHEGCIIRIKSNHSQFKLPIRILQAYNIGDSLELIKYGEDQYYAVGPTKCNNPPEPIPSHKITDYQDLPDPDEAVLYKEILINNGYGDDTSCRVNLQEEFGNYSLRKVTLHMGAQQFIEISEATKSDVDRFISCDTMYQEFGRNLQNFIGETITYIVNHKSNTHFNLPKIFYNKAGMNLKKPIRVYKMPDERIIIAPLLEKCFMDEEVIEPIKQRAIIKEICNECAEEDNIDLIKYLVKLVKDMTGKCEKLLTSKEEERQSYQRIFDQLNSEKKELSQRLKQVEKKVNETSYYKNAFSEIAKIINDNFDGDEPPEIIFN